MFGVLCFVFQEKAKLWADCNIVKLVFVSNDEMAEELMQKNASDWSRVAAPVQVCFLPPFFLSPSHLNSRMGVLKRGSSTAATEKWLMSQKVLNILS